MELASAIPADLKVGRDDSKYLFRESVRHLVPKTVYERKDKKGFPTPIEHWFGDKNNNLLLNYLMSNGPRSCDIFDQDKIREMLQKSKTRRRRESEKLWRCLCVAIWFDCFVIGYQERSRNLLA